MADRYGDDVLADPRAHRRVIPTVEVRRGLVVEADGGFVGEVVGASTREVVLRDRRGRERRFSLEPGLFHVDDRQVRLVRPERAAPAPRPAPVSNSGSVTVADHRARVARASRILVEGVHDAELVEQVWGHDLRVEGVVVDVLHGADDLEAVVRDFAPGPQRRLGILLDHLVGGTKESRIAATVRHPDVLVTGHPFVDVWQAVRPEVIGIEAWPQVPRGEDWKSGVATRLGFPDHQELWRRIRTSVTTWRDLDRSLIRAVEELIDFVTVPEAS
ncbi:MAG: DUF3097 family protein [Actinobacteria bacterium]|jgi:hypothetical protein|nr:DUF3097 family protein [Actinomycetota bacterium]